MEAVTGRVFLEMAAPKFKNLERDHFWKIREKYLCHPDKNMRL